MTAAAPSKPFVITGADGPIEVPAKEFYFNTKARGRRMMRNGLSNDARQVYACLELHTMGWQREDAVIMEGGKTRSLTPSDISRLTGLSKQHVRRALSELEEAGLGERRPIDGKALTKGNVAIYSWAVPRQPKKENGSHARLPFPDWFPDSWAPLKSLITRLRLEVSIDEEAARGYLSEGEEAARAYQNGIEVAARFLERVCATSKTPALNKEERTERYEEKEPTSQPDLKVENVKAPEPKPAGRPPVVSNLESSKPEPEANGKPAPEPPSLRNEVRQHLESFRIPRLTDDVVEQVAKHINRPALLEQFKQETAPNRVQPQRWALLIRIAAEVGADGERYAKAATAGNSESPPMTTLERKAADYARRRKQEQGRANPT